MSSWNLISDDTRRYVMLNSSFTRVTVIDRVREVDVLDIMSEMEYRKVPPAYAEQLDEIRFTVLKRDRHGVKHGDYCEGRIRLSCSPNSRPHFSATLIHELGHHMDEIEDISGDHRVADEKRRAAKFMPDRYARHSVSEYVAVGFEYYYLGDRLARWNMRKNNPRLWREIDRVHRKYSKR